MHKVKVFPSLLAADFSRIEEEIKKVESAGADAIHLDVMDNKYVSNTSFPIEKIKSFREKISVPLDIHLMIEKPENSIDGFLEFNPSFLSFHAETCSDVNKLIQKIKSHNCKVGLAVNTKIPVSSVFSFIHLIDFVLIMTVEAGFGGQKFMQENVEKIKELSQLRKQKNLFFEIEVDGGINTENSKELISAGVSMIVSGTTIFKSASVKETIRKLRNY
ncbi:ribulose-phosphate 3-epimerase [Candidatus Micrarchaeota archaeon]|nr:ribulose-phosphate 3-epimerase [Candidatus Micrarchaeota archaeon]MBU2476916.1 ribulose-phosphate 3-epimerase [Candidatus Micrarchaeota archaeon]